MIRTFIEFTLRATRNRIVHQVRRLRDPRYLIGGIGGIVYLWLVFFRNARGMHSRQFVAVTGDVLVDVLSVVVLGMMIMAWALPSDSGGLQFTEAEISFLFSAPLRRRDLLLYKIIRAQPRALSSAVAFFIFGWRRSWFIGMWAAISVLSIYFILVALGRARLKLLHIGFVARLLIVSALLTTLASIGASNIKRHPIVIPQNNPMLAAKAVDAALNTGTIRAVLFIPKCFATAASAPTLPQLASSVAGVLALGVVFFVLAARLNVSFEEASITSSAKRAAMVQRMRDSRTGRRRVAFRRIGSPFRLGETGVPEVAIVWKNVIALLRTNIGFVVVFLALTALMLGMVIYGHQPVAYRAMGSMFLFMTAFFPLAAPQIFANDLRLDLARAEILKSYPLSGDRLVAAEIAAPLAVITGMEMLFAVSGSVLIRMGSGAEKLARFAGTPQFVVTALVLALPICAALLVIRNAVPLYFPAWTARPTDDVRGFVLIGQRMVILFSNLLALLIVLIPAGLIFLPSIWIAYKFFSANAIFVAVATVPAAAVVAGEVWLGIKALGARFDEMDVSNEFDIVTV